MAARASTEAQAATGALKHCLQPPIASLDDNSIRARACKRSFGAARDLLLSRRDANFASRWISPAASVTAATGRFAYQFPLPADCIRVREVEDHDEDDWDVTVEKIVDGAGATVEVKVLHTDATNPKLRYTRRVEDVAQWDAEFLVAFEYLLASFMPELTHDPALDEKNLGNAEGYFDIQSKSDAREGARKQRSRTTSWISSRHGGRRTGP